MEKSTHIVDESMRYEHESPFELFEGKRLGRDGTSWIRDNVNTSLFILWNNPSSLLWENSAHHMKIDWFHYALAFSLPNCSNPIYNYNLRSYVNLA